jgi:acyl-CoA synthetase (AMP-forming)/AMP-acid ligase II/thioesterase domain-containing protein/acyl carrier protein
VSDGTIVGLLSAGEPAATALAGPAQRPLTYAGLLRQVEMTVSALNARGIGRGDRVALALANGPTLAAAVLGIAAGAAVAPLNPDAGEPDLRFALSHLEARVLIVERGHASPAAAAARTAGIPVLELVTGPDHPAGGFTLIGDPVGRPRDDGFTRAADVALLLHTSGTTSRPKTVPLTQRNLATSARHIVDTLRLTPGDRALNIMPLFHIHGLVAGVLASLAAGASVYCAPGFRARGFFRWMAEARPSWYTAVPAMHQAILAHAEAHRAVIATTPLRFIRSSSAALAPSLMRRLEETFGVPVIEAYGMTEAAHQVASNRLPPAPRKPGTVGRAAGPEVAILGAEGHRLPPGEVGEIVIRGGNVTAGYAGDPTANAQTFVDGWLRTGDLGALDADGYLTITGRLKEVINRGGHKVSPQEVDDALMQHPRVAAAAAFAFPHPTVGEEIGAVVASAPGTTVTEPELIHFLSSRLAPYKIPHRIVVAAEIPRGPTGKIPRHALAAALGLGRVDTRHDAEQATSTLEAQLRTIWLETLGLEHVSLDDNFFQLGGDSLQAVELLAAVEEALGYCLPPSVLIECGTIAQLARRIEDGDPAGCVVPVRRDGGHPPFFCVHDIEGQVLNLRGLARHLGDDVPFYAIQAVGADGREVPLSRIEDMAARYVREMRRVQPTGPYFLGGYSMGGVIAFEMTRQLHARGERVALLVLIDAYSGQGRRRATLRQWLARRRVEFRRLGSAERWDFVRQRLRNARSMLTRRLVRAKPVPARSMARAETGDPRPVRRRALEALHAKALEAVRLQPVRCDAMLLKGRLHAWDHPDLHDGWTGLVLGALEVHAIDAPHAEFMQEPHVRQVAAVLKAGLVRAYARPTTPSDSVPQTVG